MDSMTCARRRALPALAAAACLLVGAIAVCAAGRPAPKAAATFRNVTAEVGLSFGADNACWADVDNDGWTDLCAGGAVWRNDSGKRFTKMATVGPVVAADYDNDGFVDLFSWSPLKLWHNEGGKAFKECPLPACPPTVSLGACWCDINGDGFVDLYVGGYEDWDRDITYPSLCLMNRAGKAFELARAEARYRARGVTACDWNRSGKPAIYVSNYRLQPNVLWVSGGKGGLRDAAAEMNAIATSPGFPGGHSIGAAWGDFDNDGEFDLFAGNFAHVDDRGDQPKSRFLRNLGRTAGYRFEDKGTGGVHYQESYASPAVGDYDNDGNLDLFFTTVYPVASFGRPNHPVLFRGSGRFTVADVTTEAGLAGLGATYQAAWADFDNDGRLDLVADGKLWHNEGPTRSWLEARLWGDGKRVNRAAVGAQVRVKLASRTLSRQVEAGTGQGNQNDLTLHFGLGAWDRPVTLEVTWPGGRTQTIRGVRPNRRLEIGPRPKAVAPAPPR